MKLFLRIPLNCREILRDSNSFSGLPESWRSLYYSPKPCDLDPKAKAAGGERAGQFLPHAILTSRNSHVPREVGDFEGPHRG